jgi:hypothetical protein
MFIRAIMAHTAKLKTTKGAVEEQKLFARNLK